MPRTYLTYNWIGDKDPVIFEVERIVHESGLSDREVEKRAGVSEGLLRKWFRGSILRPQHATIKAISRVCGHDYQITRSNVHVVEERTYNVVQLRGRSSWYQSRRLSRQINRRASP